MTLFLAVISGIIQGVTEFFPISSSGHLVILHALFGIECPQISFDIFLHVGTLLSVLIYFRADIARLFTEKKSTLRCIIVGSLPVMVVGLLFKDAIERLFLLPHVVGIMLFCTGVWLAIAQCAIRHRQKKEEHDSVRALNPRRAFFVGIAQSIGLLPGISRSGATIGTALILGVPKEEAFSFSFLLSIPAIAGVTVLKLYHLGDHFFAEGLRYFIVGGFVAMIVGLFVLKALFSLIKARRLYFFGIYCIVFGILVFLFA